MNDKIRVNYQELEEFAKRCEAAAEVILESHIPNIKKSADVIRNDALKGDVGETVADALSGPFVQNATKLGEKFKEVAADIRAAMEDMRAADQGAGSNF
jgi:uncharacterized protein YukE